MLALNQTVKIADKASFYNGHLGKIADRAVYGDIVVYTVHVLTASLSLVSVASLDDKLEVA